MADLSLMKVDIIDILNNKKLGKRNVLIYETNVKFLNDFLKKEVEFIYNHDHDMPSLDLTKITQKDVSTLQEYLDYLNMIEG